MMWFFKRIFSSQDDGYNELEDRHRYHQSGQASVVERSSGEVEQSDSEIRVFFGDVKIAHSSSVPQSSQGPSFTSGGSHVHPRTPVTSHVPPLVPIAHSSSVPQSSQGQPSFTSGGSHVHPRTPVTSHVPPLVPIAHSSSVPQSSQGPSFTSGGSHVPPLVPIARPHQACPDIPPQRAVIDWSSSIEKASSISKIKPPLYSSSSNPTTNSPLKTPSVSTPLSSLAEHQLLYTLESSSSSTSKRPLTSFPENALPVSKPLQPSASSSSHKSALPLVKQTLAPSPSISRDRSGKMNYTYVEKGTSPKNIEEFLAETDVGPKVVKKQAESLIYIIPKDIVELIEEDIVPGVLRRPLSPSTYTDYFAALLYAEDFYCERGTDYLLEKVTLELHEASIYRRGNKLLQNEKDDKTFVAFDMDSVQERRPFLLSRDFVHLKPSASDETIQGVIYRVVKSKTVLVEFDEDFYAEHYPSRTYDVSFSFNRVCLKRAHQAVKAASAPSLRSFLFPDVVRSRSSLSSSPTRFFTSNKLGPEDKYVVSRIVGLKGSPPFLLEGGISSYTVIREAIVHIVRTFPNSRILVCAPTNNACDTLMTNLKKEIPESDMFRANAAFRERHLVPDELLPSCRYDDECFICPSLKKLKKFKVVSCTYVSSFRLNGEGITAGHFSHIFLVDGSSVTEPDLMIALATFANDDTSVVVTGEPRFRSGWVHSKIARENGLTMSYFERLRKRSPYKDLDPMFIAQL